MDTSELVSLHQQKQQIISTELIYKLLRVQLELKKE